MSGRKRWAALLVALFAALVGMMAGTSSSLAEPPYSPGGHKPHISCTPRATVHAKIHCDGDGYLPNDHVIITLHTTTYTLGAVDTDAKGAFKQKLLQLPAGVVGIHTITGTGRDGAPTDVADTQILIVAPGGSGTGGQSGTQGNGNGGLSTTGVAVLGISVVGVGLIAGGAVMVFGARRRRQALV